MISLQTWASSGLGCSCGADILSGLLSVGCDPSFISAKTQIICLGAHMSCMYPGLVKLLLKNLTKFNYYLNVET